MSSLPTRRLRQRKSLPPRLGPTTRLSQSLNTANTNVNSPNSNLSPVKGEQVTTRKRESLPEKEQLPSNVQFMFNSLPSKNFPSSRLSDSSLNFHGDKFRRFGENVDHIYGVLKSSRRTQQTFDSISKTSPKKVKGRHLDAFRQDEIDNENKVFGDYPVGLLNHNEVIFPYNAKTQHGNMSSKQMNDKRKFLGLQVENRTKSEILLNTHDCKNNVGKKSSLVSPTAYDSDFSAKDCIPDRRQNRVNCLSVQNIKTEIEEEDSSDSDYEVTCNMQRVRSRLSSSRRTSGYNMEDYTDSSSYTSSEQSTPDRKRKRHSSEFSDTDYVPKKSRPVRKNAQIVPVPSPVRTQKLLLEVNEKLQQHMKNKESLKTTDVKEEREDIEMETRGGVNMKFAQGSECDPTEVKKKKDGRGRPRLPENRDKIYKPEVKKQRKPGSGRPRKYPIDPGSTRPRKFPTNPGSGNTKNYPGGPEKMFTQAKNRFTVLASQVKAPVVHDEPVRVDAKYNFAPNDEVLARWNDGILYYGHIIKVDEAERKCYVKFDDNSKFWIMFKDLQKGAPDDDDDELCMCSVCNGGESEVPNEIVLCDSCGLAYHQQCHTPNIGEDVLKPDVEWKCRLCVFAAAVKEGGAVKTGPTAEALQRMKQVLPYDIDRLTWDAQHRVNVERTYCYCGGPGLWSKKMLQCCRCRQWFHEACIQCLDHPLMTGDKFYVFVCSHCNAGPEYIKRLEMTWSDVIHLALYCMSSQCGLPKKLYEEEEIIEFINSHWEQLQLKQFSEVTSEDRKAKILEELSSPCNRRFSNGQELGKPATLWSLRQRLPPPAPTIMLPFEGKVTEAVMQTLQLIGKGRVKYLVPKDSPILTDLIKTEKPDGGIKDKVKETAESAPAVRPSSGFPLDRLIPFPDNFTGYNHPFKTEVEQREERHFEFRKMQIMNYLCLNSDGDCLSQHSTASCSTDDPTKAIPTPPPSLSGGHISDLPYPTKQSDIKDSRKRKAPEDNPPSSLRQSKRKRVSVSGRYGIDPDIMDFQSLDDLRSLDEYSEKFKMGVNNYNSTSDRLKKGEKYKVLGKRISPDGKVHYLVQWEGLITKDK